MICTSLAINYIFGCNITIFIFSALVSVPNVFTFGGYIFVQRNISGTVSNLFEDGYFFIIKGKTNHFVSAHNSCGLAY